MIESSTQRCKKTPLRKIGLKYVNKLDGHLVRVDGNTEEARVGVDELVDVADPQVPEHGGVVQVGQVRHVVTAVELGRIDLAYLVLLEHLLLTACHTIQGFNFSQSFPNFMKKNIYFAAACDYIYIGNINKCIINAPN